MKQKHLFLTGDIGTGKSTLIRKTLLPHIKDVSGFFVQRVYNGSRLKGFRMCSPSSENYLLDTQLSDKNFDTNLFIENYTADNWKINTKIFVDDFFRYLNNTETKNIILLDEIGGFELGIEKIRNRINVLLDGDIPVVGVIKSKKNKDRMKEFILHESKITEEQIRYSNLLNHRKIEIFNVNQSNKQEAYNKLLRWLGDI